jgi:hypothetical protein
VTAPSPTPRQERFDQLCREINDLIARYPAMPPGRPQSICQTEIENRLREIDALNAEQYAEDLATNKPSYLAAGKGQAQGIAAGAVLLSLGLLLTSYTLVALGGAVMLFSLGITRTAASRAPQPPIPAHERFQWRP